MPVPTVKPDTATLNETVVDVIPPLDANVTENGTWLVAGVDVSVNVPLTVFPTWVATTAVNVPWPVPLSEGSRQLLSVMVPEP